MLKRLVELNNKISKLELEFTTLSTKQYFTYDDDEELEDDKLIKDEFIKELEEKELEEKELEEKELEEKELEEKELEASELVAKDEVFEIINTTTNTTNTPAIASKKSGWFPF
jgi:hypothetical protein